ncbi:MAG: hypothetical protein ACI86H_000746 [bacterium]|jgi:hypothetical protein
MQFLQESWILWLFVSVGCLIALNSFGRKRDIDPNAEMAITSDQFSMKTVFFNFRTGEADIFIAILSSSVSFFLFSIGVVLDLPDIFGSF